MVLTVKQQKQGGEGSQTQNLAGQRVFSAGHPSALSGQCFSGVVTAGSKKRNDNIPYIYKVDAEETWASPQLSLKYFPTMLNH